MGIECKKERAEKEMKEKAANQKVKEEYAMMVDWGSGIEDSDTEDVDETAFMAAKESDLEEDDKFEVSIHELKEKLPLFFQKES